MDLQALKPGKKIVTGEFGNPEASIVFIGESPSPSELAKSEPSKTAIKVLQDVFPNTFTEEDFFYFNAIPHVVPKCKDAKKNLDWTTTAALKCHDYVNWMINKHPRKIVVCLGNAAIWALTGDYTSKITRIRGQLKNPTEARSYFIMPSVHPSFLMRGGGSYQKFKRDINYALDINNGMPRLQWRDPQYEVAQDKDDVHRFIQETCNDARRLNDYEIGADIETDGFDHIDNKILCTGWCIDPSKVYIVPERLMPFLATFEVNYSPFLNAGFNNGTFEWTWHNGKFDIKFLRSLGVEKAGVDQDTMLMSYTMEERGGFHDLDQVAADELGAPNHKDMLDEYLPSKKESYRSIPENILWEYLAKDVSKTKAMSRQMLPRIQADTLNNRLYHKVLLPASELLSQVEHNGMYIDMIKQQANVVEFQSIMKEHHAVLNESVLEIDPDASYKTSGTKANGGGLIVKGINPNSPKQLSELLYSKLKLGSTAKGTGAEVLEKLPNIPVVRALKAYRKAAKAYGTFVKPLPQQVSSDLRVHSTFLLHGTGTGRLASRSPNLQNQIRDPRIRDQFRAEEGNILCEMDLDQAELRCLAALSGDEALCHIYETAGLSLHKEVSFDLWGEDWPANYKRIDEFGKNDTLYIEAREQYMRTKALNFGIVYGREAGSIATEFEIPVADAQFMIDGWANKFPDAWKFIRKCRNAPIKGQNLVTPFGRRKRAGVIAREKIRDLQNEASNFPHQSIASDITLMSAVKAAPWLTERGIKIVNLVHDAIIVELKDDKELFKTMARHVTGIMEQTPIDWGITRIPFSADAKLGHSWGDLKDAEF